VDHAPHKLELDAGVGYVNEQRVTGDDISSAVLDLGSRYSWKFSKTAEFTDELRFNQSLSDGDDWRIGHIAAVSAKLTTLLSLKFSHAIRYRHAPPPGFESTDTITSAAVVAKF
jgi:putative salt-induced outer membrane protein YdiY